MRFFSIVLLSTLAGIASSAYAGERYEVTGRSMAKHKSLPNALVAAHFRCNRQRLWANLDTMHVMPTVSDRSRQPTYRTTVHFECTPHYEKNLPEDREVQE